MAVDFGKSVEPYRFELEAPVHPDADKEEPAVVNGRAGNLHWLVLFM